MLAWDFRRRFRGRVLDVGCGRSLFTDISRSRKFKIVAGDVVWQQIKERKEPIELAPIA
jgi:2-polyprenyl-3-methyl-5-hydroxy-6-metoxy-1,4-benzoquinol methylase